MKSWHSRVAILGYIQVMVFCNLFTMKQAKYKKEIQNFILHLICDDQVEVSSSVTHLQTQQESIGLLLMLFLRVLGIGIIVYIYK